MGEMLIYYTSTYTYTYGTGGTSGINLRFIIFTLNTRLDLIAAELWDADIGGN